MKERHTLLEHTTSYALTPLQAKRMQEAGRIFHCEECSSFEEHSGRHVDSLIFHTTPEFDDQCAQQDVEDAAQHAIDLDRMERAPVPDAPPEPRETGPTNTNVQGPTNKP